MFDVITLDMARLWHTPSLGELAELLLFYDRVDIRTPYGRLGQLIPRDADNGEVFLRLIDRGKIRVAIDQLPLGEVALELGLMSSAMGAMEAANARARFAAAYPDAVSPPSFMQLSSMDAETRRLLRQWELLMERVERPTSDPAYLDRVIENACAKLTLIADPAFLPDALAAYTGPQSASMRAAFNNTVTRPVEIEGQPTMALDISGPGAPAKMLAFLSQADALLDSIRSDSRDDAYASPDVDKWTHGFVEQRLRAAGPRQQIEAFQTAVLGGSGVAQAVDANARAFRDVEKLLESREPFARAVRGRPIETSLIQAYFDEIKNVSWFAHGTGKVVRYSAFTGASLAAGALLTPLGGAATGAALGALDYFVIDNLVKGNACRAFVEGPLTTFVKS